MGDNLVAAVREAARRAERSRAQLDRAVQDARTAGASWTEIGDAVGITRQSACERWRQDDGIDVEPALVVRAARLVIETTFAGPAMLQRKLRLSEAKAQRLLEILESHGIVGPAQGAKARDVLADPDELDDIVGRLRQSKMS